MSIDSLPHELFLNELWPLLSVADRFVLRFVNQLLCDLVLSLGPLLYNPTEDFIKLGYLSILKWDQTSTHPCSLHESFCFRWGVDSGELEIVNFLVERGMRPHVKDLAFALIKGNLELAEYFVKAIGCSSSEWGSEALKAAASTGILETVRFVVDHCSPGWFGVNRIREALYLASSSPKITLELMEYLVEKVDEPTEFSLVVPHLALSGNPSLIRWARGKGFPLELEVYYANAALSGNVELLDIAESAGLRLTSPSIVWTCFGNASMRGHIGVLQWLSQRGHRLSAQTRSEVPNWNSSFIRSIAQNHLEAFSLCVNHGLPLSWSFYECAIVHRRENFLNLLDELNCPIEPSSLLSAVASESRSMVVRLLEKGFEASPAYLCAAMKSKDLQWIKWLIQQGFSPSSAALDAALYRGNLPVVKLLHEEYGVPFDQVSCWSNFNVRNTNIVEYIIKKGLKIEAIVAFDRLVKDRSRNIRVLYYLVDHGMELTPEMPILAAKALDFQILKFLHSKGVSFDISDLVREVNPQLLPNPHFPPNEILSSMKESRARKDMLNHQQLDILKWLKDIENNSTGSPHPFSHPLNHLLDLGYFISFEVSGSIGGNIFSRY